MPREMRLVTTILLCCLLFALVSCTSAPKAARDSGGNEISRLEGEATPLQGMPPREDGVTEEVRRLTESGILSSMRRSIEEIRGRNLERTEFGRVWISINTVLIRRVYPAESAGLPPPDLPQSHLYARILRNAEQGVYTAPSSGSSDYLEYVLPFIALLNETRGERLLAALPDLEKAQSLRPGSTLAPYFSGLVFERTGRLDEAAAAFTQAYTASNECYPAALGLARVLRLSGKQQEALRTLAELSELYPGNVTVKRHLAAAWCDAGEWVKAESVINDILSQDSRDGESLLMKARVLVETGQYIQAQAALDTYSSFGPNTKPYLFLRARIQAEAFHNRESALVFLRSLLRSYPGDEEASLYTAALLLESTRGEEQFDGRYLLSQLLQSGNPSVPVLSLALQDAVSRENWQEAQDFLNRLLAERRSGRDLYNGYLVEQGLGNNSRALSYARELYERDRTNDYGISVYVSALIDSGRKDEASRLIEGRLAALSGGPVKSRYYYQRSRIAADEEAVLADLRSALFEDPRNLNALIGMFEIYHRRRDERRAVYYLKQALAIAPGNPRLKRYEQEYAGAL